MRLRGTVGGITLGQIELGDVGQTLGFLPGEQTRFLGCCSSAELGIGRSRCPKGCGGSLRHHAIHLTFGFGRRHPSVEGRSRRARGRTSSVRSIVTRVSRL